MAIEIPENIKSELSKVDISLILLDTLKDTVNQIEKLGFTVDIKVHLSNSNIQS